MIGSPLTLKQREFADVNHNLVLKYLYEKRLPYCEYYDIVVFGYLKAVREFHTSEKLQKYKFSTICWRYMTREVYNHRRRLKSKKRNAYVTSVHTDGSMSQVLYGHSVPIGDDLLSAQKMRFLLFLLSMCVSKEQMEIIRMRLSGYTTNQIAKHKNLTTEQVCQELDRVCFTLRDLCYKT